MFHWILLVVMVTGCTSFLCCSGQSINVSPSSSFKLKGQQVTITCQATGLVSPSYYWLNNGVNVTRGTTGTTNLGVYYLTISSLTFTDAGSYVCYAVGSSTTITSTAIQLTVQGSPEIIQPLSSITSHVGYSVMLICVAMATPQPTLSWYFNGGQVSSAGRFTVYSNGTLAVNMLTKADSGTYSCKVKNSFGETSAFADLTVLDPPTLPRFTTTPNNITAKEGTEITFYCEATGIPLPSINWTRIGAVMPVNRQSQPRPGALRIYNLVPSDTGLYACVAKNSQGQKIAIAYLGIEGFPRFVVSPSSKEVKENGFVSFSCVVTSDPTAHLTWQLPNGTIISSLTTPTGIIHVLGNNTLVIAVLQDMHQGVYKCIAQNSAGTRKAEARLSVLTAPRFTTQLQNITKTRGDNLVVTCPARANPAPHFQWLHDGRVITSGETLRFLAVNVSSQGYYTCRVNNTLGTASGTLYLRIIVLPVITLSPSNQAIGVGGTVKFSCQSVGDPTPSITWYKSDVVIQPGSGYLVLTNNTLVIATAIHSDQGWFTCRANNAAGTVQAKAYLLITNSPRFTTLPSNKTVNLGDIVVLACRASAQDTPIITWYRVDQDGSFQKVVQNSGDLRINAAQRSDRSRYACRACNAAGCTTTPIVMLNVLYYPSFSVPPKNVGVLQSQDAVLRCEPDASPRATITWRQPNREVFGGNGYEQIIRNVQPSKTGNYECEAMNSLGKAGPITISLSIETKAVITDMSMMSNVAKVTVTCKVQGIPSPYIVWYIGRTALPQNAMYPSYTVTRDNKLQVPIGSLDEKSFLCNATNSQNSDVYFVKAPVPPTSIAATDITSTSLQVSWSRPHPVEYLVTHYQLELCPANASWTLVDGDIKAVSYSIYKLSPFTWYEFRLRSVNGLGTSNYSMTSQAVITLSSSPSAPQILTLHVAGTSEINVTWLVPLDLNGPLDNIKYGVVYYPKSPNTSNAFNSTHDTTRRLQEYSIVGLAADVRYSVYVSAWRVRREDNKNLYSRQVSAAARTLQIVPRTPPIGLVVVSNGPYKIIAKWEKPPYSVRGYKVWYKENEPALNFTNVTLSNGAATSYVVMDLKENSVYIVKIQMYSNVADQGPFSELYEVRTATDTFASIAAQSQGSSSISWKVAVGGLVCGIILLVIVVAIVWCWWKSTRKTNQTFRISRRRRRTSDLVPSSVTSEGTTQGHYNIGGFNPELDNDLDLDMFENERNVLPISTEGDFSTFDSSQLNMDAPSRDAHVEPRSENIYTNVQTETPTERGHENNMLQNNNDEQIPVYSQVDMSKKKKKSQPVINDVLYLQDDGSDADLSEVPYPGEDLPPLERTWTNVSDFNFPPPPNIPPPFDVETPSCNDDDDDMLNNLLGGQKYPPTKGPTIDTLGPTDDGPKKRRMVASWADTTDEPMGNLWEAVDKELDRRLGTT